ncbi:MAG: protein kinase [Deltaproteobacteria bacterium]|nr:protein kinase [Deltaproteobacteria bacterium]
MHHSEEGRSPFTGSATLALDWEEEEAPAVTPERYELLRPLGTGGMGEVWLAHDAWLGRQIALKLVRSDLAASPAITGSFLREARINASLAFPGVVPVYDIGTWADGRPYCTMEVIEGVSLGQALAGLEPLGRRRAPVLDGTFGGALEAVDLELSEGHLEALEVIAQVARVLERVHSAGIVHRDVKPDNVLISGLREVWVVDWGLAVEAGSPTAGLAGTPAWMAPEQARGELPSPRADVYSLGLVAAELLLGPREDRALPAADWARREAHRRGVLEEGPLLRVLTRALAAEPADRYPDARDLRADLRSALTELRSGLASRGRLLDYEARFRRLAPDLRRHARVLLGALVVDGRPVELEREQLWLAPTAVQAVVRGLGESMLREEQGRLALAAPEVLEIWPRLQVMLEDAAAFRELQVRARHAAEAWDREGRPTSALWRGDLLEKLEEAAASVEGHLPPTVRHFLSASVGSREARTLLLTRRRRALRMGVGAALVLLTASLGAALVAWERADHAHREAEVQRRTAEQAVRDSQARLAMTEATLREAQGAEHEALALQARIAFATPELGPGIREEAAREAWRLASSRVGLFRIPIGAPLHAVAWSPDGTRVAAGGDGGRLVLIAPSDGRQLAAPQVGDSPVRLLRWSEDGETLAVAVEEAALYLGPPERLQRIPLPGRVLQMVSTDGDRLLVLGLSDGTAEVRELRTGALVHRLDLGDPVRTMAAQGEGPVVLTTTGADMVGLDAAQGRELWRRDLQPWADDLAISPDGRRVATQQYQFPLILDRATGALLLRLDAGLGSSNQVISWVDDEHLLSVLRSGRAYAVPLSGEAARPIADVGGDCGGLSADPSGRLFAISGMNGSLMVVAGMGQQVLVDHVSASATALSAPSWSPDGRLAAGSAGGELVLVVPARAGHLSPVQCGGELADRTRNGLTDIVWSLASAGGAICPAPDRPALSGRVHRHPPLVQVEPSADLLAVDAGDRWRMTGPDGSWEHLKRESSWDDFALNAAGQIAVLRGSELRVLGREPGQEWLTDVGRGRGILQYPGQHGFLILGIEGGASWWDDGTLTPVLGEGHFVGKTLPTVFHAPDGQRSLAFDSGGATWLLGPSPLEARRIPTASAPGVVGAWSRDEHLFASADEAGTVTLWDPERGEALRQITHPWGLVVLELALSQRGDRLAATYENGELIVYDTATGARVVRTTSYDGSLYLFGFDPEDRLVYGAHHTRVPLAWDLPAGPLDLPQDLPALGNLRACPDGRVLPVVPFPEPGEAVDTGALCGSAR